MKKINNEGPFDLKWDARCEGLPFNGIAGIRSIVALSGQLFQEILPTNKGEKFHYC